jgi:hypothetical protein
VCDQEKVVVKQLDGYTYTGPYKNCLEHGQATVTFARSSSLKSFVGQYEKGKRTTGKLIQSNGDTYEGQFKNGRMHGQGKFLALSGFSYVGAIEDGSWSGQGVMTYASGGK